MVREEGRLRGTRQGACRLSPRAALLPLLLLGGFFLAAEARAQETEPSPIAETKAPRPPSGFFGALGSEAKLYLDDASALVTAPFSWNAGDRTRAAGALVLVGGLMVFDTRIASESQERRSSLTNSISKATTGLGSVDAFYLSGGLIASGFAFHDSHLTLMGREAIEASVFSGLISNALKPVFGRVRPALAGNQTTFEPGSGNYSFPSGHATEAFAVASVVASRSSGWLVPTLAYTAASLVAFDRVNDRAHFPSDVAAGAVIGAVVGRFIVHRHERTMETPGPEISLTTLPHGLGLVARF
jgi:membrane-associated phospholipid phosphatase